MPDELQAKLSLVNVCKASMRAGASSSFSEKIICPRCQRHVTNSMGICACGENALFC
jgi:hypothetical protein